MASEAHQNQEQHAANIDATHREAYEYWGYLFKPDKCGTPLLDRLLKGIADLISRKFEPSESPDLTPSQIAAWYRDIGGNYDVLFKDTPPSSIAFIYRSLGAFHSLQPAPTDDGYSAPSIPALKKQGFVTWQTIQLLLGPEEHVPFLQRAVEKYDVVDPASGGLFPKVLPKECFPDKPDDAMETWYEGVATRLKREAEEEAARAHIAAEAGPRISTDGDGSSADERNGAFKYFEDPMYRKARPRPGFMRHVSKQDAIYPIGAEAVTSRVRHMLNPFKNRKKSIPGRYDSDSHSDEDATPTATNPPSSRYSVHKRPRRPRRDDSLPDTDSESDEEHLPSPRRTPELPPRRPQDPTPPRDYFPTYYEGDRRSSHAQYPGSRSSSKATSPQPVYGPTKSPLFATQVAQMEARNHYDRRPTMPARVTNYRPVPQNLRWAGPVSPPREADPPYSRDHHRDRNRDRERDRDRDRETISYDMGTGSSHRSRHRRRSTEDAAYPRERQGERDTARTRSHDRVKDDWDDRDAGRDRGKNADWEDRGHYDRSRDHSRERDRDRRMHREGVGGRLVRMLKEF
ncbi:hypothetical protein HBH69_175180 [Parastagonospora nodorum]|nr:hypothetical protein HBH69_175180 [Parastagonospora nodorum]